MNPIPSSTLPVCQENLVTLFCRANQKQESLRPLVRLIGLLIRCGAKICHLLENGKKISQQAHFLPNHIDFRFNQYSLILGIFFLHLFRRKTVEVLNLKKIRNIKEYSAGTLMLFLIFSNSEHPLFYVWKDAKTSLNQGVSIKIKVDVVWQGKDVCWRIFDHFQRVLALSFVSHSSFVSIDCLIDWLIESMHVLYHFFIISTVFFVK